MRITLAFFFFSLFLLHPDEVQSQISLRDISSDQNGAKQSLLGQWSQEEEKLRDRTGLVEVPQQGRQRRRFQHILYGSTSPWGKSSRDILASQQNPQQPENLLILSTKLQQYCNIWWHWHHCQIQIANLGMEDSELSLNPVNLTTNIHHSFR